MAQFEIDSKSIRVHGCDNGIIRRKPGFIKSRQSGHPIREPLDKLRLHRICALPADNGDRLGKSRQRRSSASNASQVHAADPSNSQASTGPPTTILQTPLSAIDVDAELWQVLDLCSDEELEVVYGVLHAPSPFSPVVKSLVGEREPPLVEQRGRLSLMHKIESRFRFLAADQSSLLKGSRPSYRDTLLAIRDRIDVPCSTNLSTFDLETEIFLHVLNNCVEYVQGDEDLGGNSTNEAAARATLSEGDGMSAASSGSRKPNWVERLTAPILFGVKELAPTLAKLGSVLTVTAVGRSTTTQLATQLFNSHVRYQAAVRAAQITASRGAAGALSALGRQSVLEGATRGLQVATARYSALQGALSFIGPVMWGWLAVDLAYKAIGTDYARVIRAVFILAQVRLLRTHGFTNPSSDASKPGPESKGKAKVVEAESTDPTLDLLPPYQRAHGNVDKARKPWSDNDDPHTGYDDVYN